MPLPLQTPINRYVGNGTTTVFAYQFLLLRAGDLQVTVDGVLLTLTTHYSISGIGTINGGSVTFVTAPGSGSEVVIARVVPLLRDGDYQEGGDLPAETLDADFDRIWMVIQGMIEGVNFGGRVVLLPPSYPGSVVLPSPEAFKRLGWNATGDAIVNYDPAGGVIVVQGSVPDYLLQNVGVQ